MTELIRAFGLETESDLAQQSQQPANWETSYLIPHGSADGQWGVCEEGGGDMVAHIVEDRPNAEAEANILAAAPAMLAALESFLRAPSIGSSGPGSVTIEVQTFNLDAARAAIAKAKGAA